MFSMANGTRDIKLHIHLNGSAVLTILFPSLIDAAYINLLSFLYIFIVQYPGYAIICFLQGAQLLYQEWIKA